jgi:hypothetical protein
MKHLKIVVPILLLFAILTGIVYALTPPPPPPVPQNIGLYDTSIDFLATNVTDQSACRTCHPTSGISSGSSNAIGGAPTRHHNMLPENITNPKTNAQFGCTDCHPFIPGVGNGILLDRSCVDCHNGTDFYANSIGAHIGNFSRPHHVNTTYDDSDIGNPAAARLCKFCHGSFVENYNDGHYKPTYSTEFNLSMNPTPFATFKITNFSQPDGLGGNKTWGGCLSCHLPNPSATPAISSNVDTHHKEILGFAGFGGQTSYQNASTPFNVANICSVCHVIDVNNVSGRGSTFPLLLNITNNDTELLINAMQVRNSTIEEEDAANGSFDFVSANGNITINGTGCEKCHGVLSLHNIQLNLQQNGPQGFGHINNISDCYGCHNAWLPADAFAPSASGGIPSLNTVSPSVILAGISTNLTITGLNFDVNFTNVSVDGVAYNPTSITDTQIVVNIPALRAGTHQLQIVEDTNALSKLSTLTVVPNPTITSAKLSTKGGYSILTITGINFGIKPANSQLYVSVRHTGNQIVSTTITSWSNTLIKATFLKNTVAINDTLTVITIDTPSKTAGEVQTVITS